MAHESIAAAVETPVATGGLKKRLRKKTLLSALFVIGSICAFIFVYLLFNVVSHENSYSPAPADAIVVLGHSIDAGDSTPDAWLEARLLTALALYQEDYAEKIIVSGGRGPGDPIPVARAMAAWFMEKGVAAGHLFIEDQSNNTGENFKFSKIIADENGIESVLVVTNDFHMYRSMIIATDYFTEISGRGAAVDFGLQKALAYLKEPLSIVKYKMFYDYSGT